MDSLRKQITRVSFRGTNGLLGCFRTDLDGTFSRDQALGRPLGKVSTRLRRTSVFWQ